METSRVDGVKTPLRTVVLPQPFAPTIIVNGLSNSIACSLSGEKALMPRIANFSIWDMVAWFVSRAARLGVQKLLAAFGAAAASGGLVSRRRGDPSAKQRCAGCQVKRVSSRAARYADQLARDRCG